MKRLTKEIFILKAREVHGWKYDYSKVEYKNNSTKVCIICPVHGEFWQTPQTHLNKSGCPKCKSNKLSNLFSCKKENFIKKAKLVHGDKYDYSKVNYVNNRTKICIICPEHGEFLQTPDKHLQGQGCNKCCRKNSKYTKEEFIEKAREVHGDKYDYSKVIYKGNKEKVYIICPEHGEFLQTPYMHLQGQGCKYCTKGDIFNLIDFIKKAKIIHGNKYDYSKVEYKGMNEKVCIICPEHGEFLQKPVKHITMQQDCPKCSKQQYKSETNLYNFIKKEFEEKNIEIIHSFKNRSILGKQEIDIYIPKYKIGIEYQGIQHFQPIDFGGYGKEIAEKQFINNINRDIIKKEKCIKNDIKLLYYSDINEKNEMFGEKIYHTYNDLIEVINQVIKKEDEK